MLMGDLPVAASLVCHRIIHCIMCAWQCIIYMALYLCSCAQRVHVYR